MNSKNNALHPSGVEPESHAFSVMEGKNDNRYTTNANPDKSEDVFLVEKNA